MNQTNNNEEWRPVVGYEGIYEVSNLANVKSFAHDRPHWMGGVRHYPERLMKQKLDHGYPMVRLTKNHIPKHKKVHRLIAEVFIPNPENKPCINHIDGVRNNNQLSNLEWCTYSENNLHAYRVNGRINPKGMLGHTRAAVSEGTE